MGIGKFLGIVTFAALTLGGSLASIKTQSTMPQLKRQVLDRLKAGSLQSALTAANTLRENYPEFSSNFVLLAHVQMRVQDYDGARRTLDEMPLESHNSSEALLYRGLIAFKMDEYETSKTLSYSVERPKFSFDGLADGTPTIERDGLESLWSFLVGKLCIESEVDVQFGTECLQKVIQHNPKLLAARYILATQFVGAREYRKGIDQLVYIHDHSTGALRDAIGSQLSDIAKVYREGEL